DKALTWIQNGAQPTETCRAILSYKGVLMKKFILEGVKKGVFDEAEGEKRFAAWLEQKEARVSGKVTNLADSKAKSRKEALTAETKKKEARAEAIAKKNVVVEETVETETAEEETNSPEASAATEEVNTAEETTTEADTEATEKDAE